MVVWRTRPSNSLKVGLPDRSLRITRMYEEADEALYLGPAAVGDVHAHRDVVLRGVVAQQRLVGGKQSHRHRPALAAAQLAQPPRQLLAQLEAYDTRAPRRAACCPRLVGWQFKGP